MLSRERNRGYVLAALPAYLSSEALEESGVSETDAGGAAYFCIAEDRMQGVLPDNITETALSSRYQLTLQKFNAVLGRISQEGWAERKPGCG